jgi:hypothetical protein
MNQKTKQIIIAIVVIVAAFIGFKMFFPNNNGSSDVALVADNSSAAQFIDGQAILALLHQLEKVNLDNSIFTNKVFTGLVSFERPIEDQIPGRANPFLPIGVEGSGGSIPKATSTSPVR